MATYIKAPDLPMIIDLGDQSVEQAARLVESWCDGQPRFFHWADVGAVMVNFQQLACVFISTIPPGDERDAKPVVAFEELLPSS